MNEWFLNPLRQALMAHFVLEISITEKCNLSCQFCCHATVENRIKRHMTIDEITSLSEVISDNEFFAIKISGGEPTVHPHFTKIINNLRRLFKANFYCLATNGIRVIEYKQELSVFDNIEISHYIGKNDDLIKKIKKHNLELPITFIERVDGVSMHNVFEEKNRQKKNVFNRCRYPAWKKVVQGRIYPCSNIFGLAIRKGLDKKLVSVPINSNWRDTIKNIDIEEHCRKCWVNVDDPQGRACRLL